MTVWIGTSGWQYDHWRNRFYPPGLPQRAWYESYAERFATVESNAAFYAAQMTAMDAATRNSADMIEQLTLYMNKVRQAAITREIIEVVSGAGAL